MSRRFGKENIEARKILKANEGFGASMSPNFIERSDISNKKAESYVLMYLGPDIKKVDASNVHIAKKIHEELDAFLKTKDPKPKATAEVTSNFTLKSDFPALGKRKYVFEIRELTRGDVVGPDGKRLTYLPTLKINRPYYDLPLFAYNDKAEKEIDKKRGTALPVAKTLLENTKSINKSTTTYAFHEHYNTHQLDAVGRTLNLHKNFGVGALKAEGVTKVHLHPGANLEFMTVLYDHDLNKLYDGTNNEEGKKTYSSQRVKAFRNLCADSYVTNYTGENKESLFPLNRNNGWILRDSLLNNRKINQKGELEPESLTIPEGHFVYIHNTNDHTTAQNVGFVVKEKASLIVDARKPSQTPGKANGLDKINFNEGAFKEPGSKSLDITTTRLLGDITFEKGSRFVVALPDLSQVNGGEGRLKPILDISAINPENGMPRETAHDFAKALRIKADNPIWEQQWKGANTGKVELEKVAFNAYNKFLQDKGEEKHDQFKALTKHLEVVVGIKNGEFGPYKKSLNNVTIEPDAELYLLMDKSAAGSNVDQQIPLIVANHIEGSFSNVKLNKTYTLGEWSFSLTQGSKKLVSKMVASKISGDIANLKDSEQKKYQSLQGEVDQLVTTNNEIENKDDYPFVINSLDLNISSTDDVVIQKAVHITGQTVLDQLEQNIFGRGKAFNLAASVADKLKKGVAKSALKTMSAPLSLGKETSAKLIGNVFAASLANKLAFSTKAAFSPTSKTLDNANAHVSCAMGQGVGFVNTDYSHASKSKMLRGEALFSNESNVVSTTVGFAMPLNRFVTPYAALGISAAHLKGGQDMYKANILSTKWDDNIMAANLVVGAEAQYNATKALGIKTQGFYARTLAASDASINLPFAEAKESLWPSNMAAASIKAEYKLNGVEATAGLKASTAGEPLKATFGFKLSF